MSFLKRMLVFFLTFVFLLSSVSFFAEENEPEDGAKEKFDVEAPFALIINAETGTVLFEKNAKTPFFCGFLPRLMTCILLVESGLDLDTEILITKEMMAISHDQSSANLRSGDRISLLDLMECILVANSQEAAIAVATTVSGSVSQFVVDMNLRARALGAESTVFTNVTGQYSSTTKQSTTAYDIAMICLHALSLDYIEDISNYRYIEVTVNGSKRQLFTKNSLVDKNSSHYYKKASGLCVSGGSTSGYSLVSVAEDKAVRLVSIASTYGTIGSLYDDITNMIRHSLEEYSTRVLIQKNAPVCEIPIVFGKERDNLTLVAEQSLSTSLPSSVSDDEIVRTINAPEKIEAPVAKGTVYGTITYGYEGRIYGTTNIIAQTDISLDVVARYSDSINRFFTNKYVLAAIITVIVIIVFYSVILFISSRRQRKRNESRKRDRLNKSPK